VNGFRQTLLWKALDEGIESNVLELNLDEIFNPHTYKPFHSWL